MERRKALAIASTVTVAVGTGIVAAAALSGASLLGFGGRASAHAVAPAAPMTVRPTTKERVVVRTHNVYDRVVVTTSPASPARSAGTAGDAVVREPDSVTTPTTVGAVEHEARPNGSDDGPDTSEPPATVASPEPHDTTTTAPEHTPTTGAPEIPDDWPAGKPVPPIPPNCQQPELHLNGVWECSGTDD